jgi:hypothetical protein
MSDDNQIQNARDGVALVTEIIKAAGDSKHVKEAADNLGQTAVTLTKTINNVLVPLAAINFAFDKAREYFSGRFQEDMAAKAANIPPENIIEPKASVAGPTLQGLAFAHEDSNLKEMFLNLLTTAMDSRVSNFAHPAFVEIIKQLDGEDARLVRGVLISDIPTPMIQVRGIRPDNNSYITLQTHILNLTNTLTKEPVEDKNLPAMIDNWIRLGLVTVDYDKHLSDLQSYSWSESRPEVKNIGAAMPEGIARIEIQKGIMSRTDLGKRFSKSIGLII